MVIPVTLTTSEAGYVLGRPATSVNKAVDGGEIRAIRRSRGNRTERLIGSTELRYLRLAGELERDLTPAGRRRLYQALRTLPDGRSQVELGRLVLDLRQVDADLADRLNGLDEVRRAADPLPDADGNPIICGTTIPIHLVAALAHSQTVDEIVDDYPSLSPAQVRAAIEYACAYPKRGRPFPTRSFKRMIADLAAHEVETVAEGAGPRLIGG